MGLRVIFFIVKHILLEWVWSQFLRAGAPTLEPEEGAGRVCCATYALILDSFWRQTSLARSPYPLFFNIKTISVSIFILFDGYHGYSKSSNFFLPSFTPQLISAQITLLFSHSVVSHSLRPHGLQHNRLPCPSPSPGACSNSCPLSQWCHPTISSSVAPSPAFNLSQDQGLFQWVKSSHQVVKVLEFQLQHQSFQWIFRTDFL